MLNIATRPKRHLEQVLFRSMNICLRKIRKTGNLTAGNEHDTNQINDIIRQDDGFRVLKPIRSSPAFWEAKKKDVLAMVRQLGNPTFFLTTSYAELKNPELLASLYNLSADQSIGNVPNNKITPVEALLLDKNTKSRLVRDDSVSVVRQYEHRQKILLNHCKRSDGFGPFKLNYVIDSFKRNEMQMRGYVHSHFLLWLKNAPEVGNISENEEANLENVISFIDEHISCKYDPKNPLIAFQRHAHTFRCYKGMKSKKKCAFDFPRPVMPYTRILYPYKSKNEITKEMLINYKKITELMQTFFKNNIDLSFEEILTELNINEEAYISALRSSLSKPKIFLKRRSLEVSINNYNLEILHLIESNIDIQFILDPYSCASYIVNYISKSESGLSKLLKETIDDVQNGNQSIRERLRKVSNVFNNSSVLSAQEAIYHALSLPLVESSRATEFINTHPISSRTRMLKSPKDLLEMDVNSTDIYRKSIIEYYADRPKELQNICLAEFVAYYSDGIKKQQNTSNKEYSISEDICGQDTLASEENDKSKNNRGTIKKRKYAKVIKYCRFKLHENPLEFYRENILLFLPWKEEKRDVENIDQKDKYEKNIDIILCNRNKFNRINDDDLEAALQKVDENNKEFEEDCTGNLTSAESFVDIFDQVGKLHGKKDPNLNCDEKKIRYSAPKLKNSEDVNKMMEMLNTKQREFVMHVLHCFKTNQLPLRIFLSGSAGVGKSIVISTLYHLLTNYINSQIHGEQNKDKIKILLCAYSGKAAFLINGITLHSAFSLPVNQCNKQLKELSSDIANTIRESLYYVKLIIIDEISMVGSKTFHYIDSRLQQITGKNESFGGVSVIACGDLNQLPPVMESPIFEVAKITELNALSENNLWNEFKLFELTEIMRQKNELAFIKALNNLANNKLTDEDYNLLKSRIVKKELVPLSAIRLYTENKLVDKYNEERIREMRGEEYSCDAIDIVSTKTERMEQRTAILNAVKNKKATNTSGLPYNIKLKVGITYMITNNISVEDGLVNGATGILKNITFSVDKKINILWMKFSDERIGNKARRQFSDFMKNNSIVYNLVPIERHTVHIQGPNGIYHVTRRQFPVTPAEAMTIHKSQGQTYKEVCVDFTNSSRKLLTKQMIYVALSRVQSINNLYIIDSLPIPKITNQNEAVFKEMERLRKTSKLKLSYTKEISGDKIKVIYQNINHLKNKIKYISCDQWYKQSDVLIFTETYTTTSDKISLPEFKIIYRTDTNKGNLGSGITCLVNTSFKLETNLVSKMFKSSTKNKQFYHVDMFCICVGDVYIISGYKSPKTPDSVFRNILEELYRNLKEADNQFILIGDFNIDTYNRNTNFENFMESKFKFARGIPVNVVTTNNNTQIDTIFIKNITSENYTSGVYETYFSDHKPIFFGLSYSQKEKGKVDITKRSIAQPIIKLKRVKVQKREKQNVINVGNENKSTKEISTDLSLITLDDNLTVTNNRSEEFDVNAMCARILTENKMLDADEINALMRIIKNETNFKPQDTFNVIKESYKSVKESENDLQILHDSNLKHWICIFYSSKNKKVHVYDSLMQGILNKNHINCIKKLYPKINVENDIVYESLKYKQKNGTSCGILASAYAVSLALGLNPSKKNYEINYDSYDHVLKLRQHLANILKSEFLAPFPTKYVVPKGFQNLGNSCYANSLLQVLLSREYLLQKFLTINNDTNPLKELSLKYRYNQEVLLSDSIRNALGDIFISDDQQDVEEFFTALCNNFEEIRDSFHFTLREEVKCLNSECLAGHSFSITTSNTLRIDLPGSGNRNTNLTYLIHNTISNNWKQSDNICTYSGTPIYTKSNIVSTGKYLLLQFKIFGFDNTNFEVIKYTDLVIKDLPETVITIEGKDFIPVGGIFHIGESANSGHYISYFRAKNPRKYWFEANDSIVRRQNWPKGKDKTKSLYLLVLESLI